MLPGFTFGALLAYSAMAVPQVAIIIIVLAIIKFIVKIIIMILFLDDGGEQHRHCD